MVAHFKPHVSNLKATFVFLRSIFSRLLYDITARRLQVGASSPCVGFNSTIIHFPTIFLSLHSLINVLCALWCCIIHQTKWPGSEHCQPPRLPSLTHTYTNIFHLLSVGNFLWQSNNLFHVPFECLTMCLLKKATKVYKPQGLPRGCFDPAGRHWQVHFNRSSRLFFPLWLLCTRL